MKVYKFGGASVKDAAGVRNLLDIVKDEKELFIIVSAMGKTTNALEGVFAAMQQGDQELALERVEQSYAYHRAILDELMGADITIATVLLAVATSMADTSVAIPSWPPTRPRNTRLIP